MSQVRTDFKNAPRIVAAGAGVAKCRAEGQCRVCGKPAIPTSEGCGAIGGLTRHHLVPRSLRGDDIEDNIVPLCGHGTAGCHGKVEARDIGVCSRLRASLTTAEVAYVNRKMGQRFIDRYYPVAA